MAHSRANPLEEIATAITSINDRNRVTASASEQQAQVAREVNRNLVYIRDLSLQTVTGAGQPMPRVRSCRVWRRTSAAWSGAFASSPRTNKNGAQGRRFHCRSDQPL